MAYREVFRQALRTIRFEPNELPYLALTSRPNSNFVIGSRIDSTAVVSWWRENGVGVTSWSWTGAPRALLECKAAY